MNEEFGFAAGTGHEHPDDPSSTDRAGPRRGGLDLLAPDPSVQPDHADLPASWEKSRPLQAVG
jgi:hypothetical protein